MFTRRFERRIYVALAVVVFAAGLGGAFGAYALWPSNMERGYSPEQPIAFSHALHAGDLRIDCQYCHSNASKGAHATVPPVSTCMNCHQSVQPKDDDGNLKEGIASLLEHWEAREPIEWIKVADLADFVYFEHSRHVNSGIDCQRCHGPVETMVRMRREHALKMAFCVDCHKEPADPVDTPPEDPGLIASAHASERTPQPGAGTRAPTNCTTCHR